MRNLLLILILALGAVTANAQQYTDYLANNVSLQDICDECPKNYKLYDGVRFAFFEGRIIGNTEFRQVASLLGEAVGIRYDRSGKNNISILHAKIGVVEYKLIMASLGVSATADQTIEEDVVVEDSESIPTTAENAQVVFPSVDTMSVEHDVYVHIDTIAMINMDIVRVCDPISVDMIYQEVGLVPPFGEFEWLIEVNSRWNTCNEAIDLRKARYAIMMAKKYGGYKEGPVGYEDGWFNIQDKQDRFCYKEGDKIPFLGFAEGAYKKYYHWEQPKNAGRITSRKAKPNRISMSRVKGKTNRVSIAASHRACRRG